jgi:hypothetical protein
VAVRKSVSPRDSTWTIEASVLSYELLIAYCYCARLNDIDTAECGFAEMMALLAASQQRHGHFSF